MKNSLAVWTAGNKSGILEQEEEYVFNYLADTSDRHSVSLTMPVRLKSWTHKALHPVFQMNLPEGALLTTIKNALAKIARVDELTLLRVVGANQIGRNRFALREEKSPAFKTSPESLEDLLCYPDTGELFNELMQKYAMNSGVSGIQPKVMLDAKDRATVHSSSYIVKSWGEDYPSLAANEYFCMKVVQRTGLPVPEFYLSENGRLFVMKRFDITDTGEYVGFEDMCALQGLGTEDKYTGSYERMVKTINDYVSPQYRQIAREQFFAVLTLSVMLRNGDAHLKNFGVLYADPTEGETKLAPVYDIVTTTAYIGKDVPALTIGGTKKWWDRKMLEKFGVAHCGLSVSRIAGIISKSGDAVLNIKPELKRYIKDHPEFSSVGGNMLKAWDAGVKFL
ncbi:MAG: type II toxin-antitoxin system HipA family toxin [Desulfobacterales bacterium]|nr:type II toxin-antitoxin system HipA family toxin [Desulfobacterales bacterium]